MWEDINFANILVASLIRQDKSRRPPGFCVYIGAPSSAIESFCRFRFADTTFESLGIVKILLWTPRELSLSLSISEKAMNDTLEPEGLVPSAIVFGKFPKVITLSEFPKPRMTLSNKSKVVRAARNEMQIQMVKMCVNRALNHSFPRSTDHLYNP
eukprot:IDg15441t1